MKKQTKIIATVSDRKCDIDFIKNLYEAGADVIRLNTAHQTIDETLKVINNIRKVSERLSILIDTKGPEIRISKLNENIKLNKDDEIIVKGGKNNISTNKCVFVSYNNIFYDVKVGNLILIDDGKLELKVIQKEKGKLICKAQNQGTIRSNKSVNIPETKINLPSLTEKDRNYINFAIENKVDFIAHSFVRNKRDIQDIKSILEESNSDIKIISKIENQEGVDNIDEIIDNSYGIMIARGDLGIEIAIEKIPGIQKMIINKCIQKRKIVIVATQMLESMTENIRATRAEISDIANAVYDGTDAIMLSGETAHGKYPVEAVKTMNKIALETEKCRNGFNNVAMNSIDSEIPAYLAKVAITASENLPVKAVITDTMTGRTARYLSSFRSKNPIYAQCYSKKVMRELSISYGIHAHYMAKKEETLKFLHRTFIKLLNKKYLNEDDLIVILGGNQGPKKGATFTEICTAKQMLK